MQLWHERLVYQNKRHVKCVISRYGVHLTGDKSCDGCALVKAHRGLFRNRPDPSKEPGAVTSSDICRPMETNFFGRHRYFALFKGDYKEVKFQVLRFNNSSKLLSRETMKVVRENGIEV
ncbi:hypothetical protein ILUMI_15298 [Ignelater luminosus]|uniref:Uncharacterized protein n=1 Tax=Ignelater luminosus TaxID=2038154 RepID=A0A8K0CWU2_IGNLU|nr:hypothetical protein ILUMI_15298 [Ignelater luminosus]